MFSDPKHAGDSGMTSIPSCTHWASGNSYKLHLLTRSLIYIISFSNSLSWSMQKSEQYTMHEGFYIFPLGIFI